MAMQIVRFLQVFLFGPRVSRWVARHTCILAVTGLDPGGRVSITAESAASLLC